MYKYSACFLSNIISFFLDLFSFIPPLFKMCSFSVKQKSTLPATPFKRTYKPFGFVKDARKYLWTYRKEQHLGRVFVCKRNMRFRWKLYRRQTPSKWQMRTSKDLTHSFFQGTINIHACIKVQCYEKELMYTIIYMYKYIYIYINIYIYIICIYTLYT